MTADITLRGPGDVVAILPYQLGYHPRDSVVVISLRGKRVGLVARTDLPPEEHVDEVVSTLMGPLVRDGATSVIVVGYEDDPDTSQPLLLALVEQLERAGIDVVDVAVVRDGRRYSPICSEPCCPPDGVALPDPADVPGVAEYVALGRSPLRSRGDVEGLVAPEPWRCLGVERAIDSRSRMPRARRRSVAAWRAVLDRGGAGPATAGPPGRGRPGARPGRHPVARRADRLAGAERAADRRRSTRGWWRCCGRPCRPGAAWAPARASRPGRCGARGRRGRAARDALTVERDDLLHRLLALCRSVPDECPDEAAAVCTVAAHVAWVGGDGAIARAAVERALRLAPGYRLAQLLERLVETGCGCRRLDRAWGGREAGGAAARTGRPAGLQARPPGPRNASRARGGRGYHGCRS